MEVSDGFTICHAQVGWLADKMNRVHLMFVVVLLGEAPCLATMVVTSYWQFFALRTLTGISVGGCLPLVFSLLGDLVRRCTGVAWFVVFVQPCWSFADRIL